MEMIGIRKFVSSLGLKSPRIVYRGNKLDSSIKVVSDNDQYSRLHPVKIMRRMNKDASIAVDALKHSIAEELKDMSVVVFYNIKIGLVSYGNEEDSYFAEIKYCGISKLEISSSSAKISYLSLETSK